MTKQKQVTSWSHLLIMTTGLISTCLGLVVMLGWHIHNRWLLQILPEAVPMTYNTALMFSLSGVSVLALEHKQYKIARWLAIALGVIGVLTLFQYIFDVNLGIDELLMKDYTLNSNSIFNTSAPRQTLIERQLLPGRPAFYTALSFALTAIALILICRTRKRRRTSIIAGLCGAIVAAISILSLVGYFTGVITAYGGKYSSGLAIHTAFGLLVLSIAIITLALSTKWQQKIRSSPKGDLQQDEDYGDHLPEPSLTSRDLADVGQTRRLFQEMRSLFYPLNWSIEQKTLVGLSLAAVVLIATNVFSYWNFVNYKESSFALSEQSRQVKEKVETILSQMKDAKTGQRDYIIVGRESDLKPYQDAVNSIQQQVQELKTLVTNYPKQLAQVNTLDSLVSQKLAELAETIELRKTQGFEAAQAAVQTERGKNLMEQIRQISAQIKQTENELLTQRIEQSSDNIGTQNFLIIGIILAFCLFYLVYYILKQENNKRTQALKEVQESEMRFRTMANNAPVMLGITDTMGRCIFVNQSWLDFTGSTLEKELDNGWIDHVHPDDKQRCWETYQTAFNARESFEMEYRLKSHSGEYRWILNRVAPRWLPDGSFTGYIGSSVDINDAVVAARQRQQALKELRQKELRYRSLLTATTQIVWTTNAQGEVIDYMPGWGQITGQSAEEMKGWGWLSVLHPDDQEHTSRLWTQAIQTKSLYEIEHRLLTRDGSYRDFSVRGVPVLDDNGEILEWVGTHTDITEKKQAESELQKSHNLLQTVIEGTADAIFAKDTQSRYLMINSTGARVIGKPVEDILYKNDCELFSSEFGRVFMENERQIMTTGETQVFEDNVPMMGSIRTFSSAKSVWRDAQGNVIGIVGIARDITERKLAEQKIKQLNEDLERRVIERTAELTAANKELEAFSYSVSHDLRAPLRGIDGFSQALMDRYSDKLDDKAKHYLNRIRAGTQRMGELIDDLLTLSRVTRTEMRRKEVDLSAIATEIATELKFTEPDRDVEFAIAPGLIVNGDAQLLRVVLENLLNNAWKFTSTRIQTKIEFNAILQVDAKCAYFVRDNGAGFDMAYSNKLFGAFQRLHSVTQFPGTGIGLATVQRIIHRHGGKVWAVGAVEEGATFYFTL